jgi:hypothetical protein
VKNLKKLFGAAVLTIVLTLPAFAGGIECGVAPPPPPPATSATTEDETLDSTGVTDAGSGEATVNDPVIEAALSLFESVLALF